MQENSLEYKIFFCGVWLTFLPTLVGLAGALLLVSAFGESNPYLDVLFSVGAGAAMAGVICQIIAFTIMAHKE